nr:transposase [Streptomyces sp. SID14515]
MGSKKKPPYDAEFREGAVRIVVETGRPAGEVAEELGINPGTLHSWVSRWRRNGTTSSDRPVLPTTAGGVAVAVGCGRPGGPSWSGCAGRSERRTSGSVSWRWSVMSSSDAWPSG